MSLLTVSMLAAGCMTDPATDPTGAAIIPAQTTTVPTNTEPTMTTVLSTSTTSETTSTTGPPTTSPPTNTTANAPSAQRAIAQQVEDLVWLDPQTGATEVIHPTMFEAAWAVNMGLTPDRSAIYYHLLHEDHWFSCESAVGEAVRLEVASGATETLDRGRPTLSPDGHRLAMLTAEQCYPDPEVSGFFLTAYDSLVIADLDGEELLRFPQAAEGEEAAPVSNLVWLDNSTVLVSDAQGNHFRVSVDVGEPTPIRDHETVDLPADLVLALVVDGRGLGAISDPATGPGQLLTVDLATGETAPLEVETGGFYAVGVSDEGEVLVSTFSGGRYVLLVDVDLRNGSVGRELDTPQFQGIDW